jgi:hypothetical protein
MSKLRANIFLIPTTSNYLQSSVVGVVKLDYFDFSLNVFEKLVRIRCEGNCLQILSFWNFFVFSDFSALTRLFLNQK